MSSVSGVHFPPTTDPRWTALVHAGTSHHLKVLALQLILTRVKWQTKTDPSAANVQKQIDELTRFFAKNAHMLEADSITLFG